MSKRVAHFDDNVVDSAPRQVLIQAINCAINEYGEI